MRVSFLLLLLALSFAGQCQEDQPAFGKPSSDELLMKEYDKDKSAPALKLLDFQKCELTIDYGSVRIETERRVRIKIFNKDGYRQASITIPYVSRNGAKSKITDITGYVYYLDAEGRTVIEKVGRKEIFKDKADEGISKVSFTFPNVRPGCVIEYRYTKIEKNSFHIEPWFFQDKIPTLRSVCQIVAPDVIKVERRLVSALAVFEESSTERFTWLPSVFTKTYMSVDVPAFHNEPYMSSVKDNLHRAEFTLLPQFGAFGFMFSGSNKWRSFTNLLYASPFFGGQLRKNIPGTEALIDSAKMKATVSEKIGFLFEATKRMLAWDDIQTFYAGELEEAWKKKTANSAEINLTMLNLLQKAGVTAYPVLVSTRNNGKPDKDFPSLGQFNGLDILAVDSADVYLLDGTQKYQSFRIPPLNVLNREVFLVDSVESKWVNVRDSRPLTKNFMVIRAELNDKGLVTGEATTNYYDLAKAQKLAQDPDEKNEADKPKSEAADLRIDSLRTENKDREDLPLIENYRFRYSLINTDQFFFLDPFVLSPLRKNPFLDSLRHTDVDFGSNQDFTTVLYLQLPKGFTVEHLPKSSLLRTVDSSMMFRVIYDKSEDILMIKNVFELHRAVFDKEEYPGVKEFFDKVYGMIGQQVVIKKNN